MAPRKQTRKEELRLLLEKSRATLHLPDTRQIAQQAKNAAHLAGRLPSSVQSRPARSIVIAAATACIIALLLKPRKRNKKKLDASKPAGSQLLAWTLTVSQPLVRIWLTDRVKKWLLK